MALVARYNISSYITSKTLLLFLILIVQIWTYKLELLFNPKKQENLKRDVYTKKNCFYFINIEKIKLLEQNAVTYKLNTKKKQYFK